MRRAVLLALVGLAVWVPGAEGKPLTEQRARQAIHRDERQSLKGGYIHGYRIVRCTRRSHRAVRCYLHEWFMDGQSRLVFDGWETVLFKHNKTRIVFG